MRFKKIISIYALLALLFGHVTLAQHSAAHIEHGFVQEISVSYSDHDEHQHDHEDTKHECPECLLTKSLQTAFYNESATLFFASHADSLPAQQYSLVISAKLFNSNSPRAPPYILI